jgi:ribosomal-protein-alanine N-acetyltransferase
MTRQFRRATAADLDAIMAIETAEFGTDAWSRATMRAEIASIHGYYVVAFPPDDPARIDAYAGLHAPRNEPQADIQTIAVAVAARRQGLGRALIRHLIGEARERGARELFLEVRADNPNAKALYDGLGFEAIAVRPRYYQPDDVDAIVMRLAIPEPVAEPA